MNGIVENAAVLKQQGLVFDIQRFAIHDGCGIRTLVFMKGCPLRCRWCSNPESQETASEIMYNPEKCIGCNECIEACPNGEMIEEKQLFYNSNCVGCGECSYVCYSGARQLVGKWMDVCDVMEGIMKDFAFYRETGGVTIGGGEPLLQSDFVADVFRECHNRGVRTALETCGYSTWDKLDKVLKYTDLLLFDIKHMNSALHKEFTGVGNEIIIENAIRACECVDKMIVRLPLIPDFNDSEENINRLGELLHKEMRRVRRIDILPYHSMGQSKAKRLGKTYSLEGLKNLETNKIIHAKNILQAYGLEVVVGG